MCIITDNNHIVVSISLIRGVDTIPDGFHIYEYYTGTLPDIGDTFIPED